MLGVVSTTATALTAATPAGATDISYSCESCITLNGSDNWIDEAGGTDYTYGTVWVGMWRWTGSSWKLEDQGLSETGGHVKLCTYENEFWGHAETEEYVNRKAHLSGREANYRTCSIP